MNEKLQNILTEMKINSQGVNSSGVEIQADNNIFSSIKNDLLRKLIECDNIVRTVAITNNVNVDNPFQHNIVDQDENNNGLSYYLNDPDNQNWDESKFLINDKKTIIRPALLYRRIIPYLNYEMIPNNKDSQVDYVSNFIFFDVVPTNTRLNKSNINNLSKDFYITFIVVCDLQNNVINVFNDFDKDVNEQIEQLAELMIDGVITSEDFEEAKQYLIDNNPYKNYTREVGAYNTREMYLYELIKKYLTSISNRNNKLGIQKKEIWNDIKINSFDTPVGIYAISGHRAISFKMYCEYINCSEN